MMSFLDDVHEAAAYLVAHGRRADAVSVVARALEQCDDTRGHLLLARLHLSGRTREGALQALFVLQISHVNEPANVEVIALMRDALYALERRAELARLDREVRWTRHSPRRLAPVES